MPSPSVILWSVLAVAAATAFVRLVVGLAVAHAVVHATRAGRAVRVRLPVGGRGRALVFEASGVPDSPDGTPASPTAGMPPVATVDGAASRSLVGLHSDGTRPASAPVRGAPDG